MSTIARAGIRSPGRALWLSVPVVTTVLYAASGCGDPEYIKGDNHADGGLTGSGNYDGGPGVIIGGGDHKPTGPDDDGGPRSSGYVDGGWVETADGACFEAHKKPDQITVEVTKTTQVPKPVALMLMQDRSSSMVGLCDTGVLCNAFAWQETSEALRTFANDPKSAGIDVGLGFFPPVNQVGYTQGACDGSTCGATVPISKLPGAATAISASLNASLPSGISLFPSYTPTECGMRGMIGACTEYTKATKTQCVAVLITDGTPNRCATDGNALAQIAATGKSLGVKTFAIGMTGANFTLLNMIAQSGGTDCDPKTPNLACDVSKGDSLLAALTAIRETVTVTETHTETQTQALDCEWSIPPPPAGQAFDPAKVNLSFTPDTGKTSRVAFVGTAAGCAKAANTGWYFDDVRKPTRILVCPTTCTAVKAAKNASVDIAFGCAREDAPGVVIR